MLHETGASKSIGHCPVSWFSLSFVVPPALHTCKIACPVGYALRVYPKPYNLPRTSAAYCSLCMTGELPLAHFLGGLWWEFPRVLGTAQSRGSPDHLGASGTARSHCCWWMVLCYYTGPTCSA